MSQDSIDVKYVAELARIELTDEETTAFQGQLNEILEYVQQLQEIDVSSVPDTPIDPALPVNVLRVDEIRPSLPVEKALSNAPAQGDDMITVPKVVE